MVKITNNKNNKKQSKSGEDVDIKIKLSGEDNGIKKIRFMRLAEGSYLYYDSFKVKAWLCCDCKAIITNKEDHVRWHQQILDTMIAIAYKTISLEELQGITYQPVEVNPTVSTRKNNIIVL